MVAHVHLVGVYCIFHFGVKVFILLHIMYYISMLQSNRTKHTGKYNTNGTINHSIIYNADYNKVRIYNSTVIWKFIKTKKFKGHDFCMQYVNILGENGVNIRCVYWNLIEPFWKSFFMSPFPQNVSLEIHKNKTAVSDISVSNMLAKCMLFENNAYCTHCKSKTFAYTTVFIFLYLFL